MTTCQAGHELAPRHHVGIVGFRQPLALVDESVAEIAQMSYRPAESGQA
jgi:hypothetical protein